MRIGRPARKSVSPDMLAAAAASLIEGDETVQALATDLGIPYTTLVRWLRSVHPDAMEAHDARQAAARLAVAERAEAVVRLVTGGATVAEAAAKLGISWDDANNALARLRIRVSDLREPARPGPRASEVAIHRQRRRPRS